MADRLEADGASLSTACGCWTGAAGATGIRRMVRRDPVTLTWHVAEVGV